MSKNRSQIQSEENIQLVRFTRLFFNSNNKMFKGKIKSLELITDLSSFLNGFTPGSCSLHYFYEQSYKQKLTIQEDGHIEITKWEEETQETIETLLISSKDTRKIFNRIADVFREYQIKEIFEDEGTWKLKLINTEGEEFLFEGNTSYDHRKRLSRISALIRNITGLDYIHGFDQCVGYSIKDIFRC